MNLELFAHGRDYTKYFKRLNTIVSMYKQGRKSLFCGNSKRYVMTLLGKHYIYNYNFPSDSKIYFLCWKSKSKEENFYTKNIIFVNKSNNGIFAFSRKLKELNKKSFKLNFLNILKSIFIKILGYKKVISYLASNYCKCQINESDVIKDSYVDWGVSESQYNYQSLLKECIKEGICEPIPIYVVRKDFTEHSNGFKIKNNLILRYFVYGEIQSLDWTIFGERIKEKK